MVNYRKILNKNAQSNVKKMKFMTELCYLMRFYSMCAIQKDFRVELRMKKFLSGGRKRAAGMIS